MTDQRRALALRIPCDEQEPCALRMIATGGWDAGSAGVTLVLVGSVPDGLFMICGKEDGTAQPGNRRAALLAAQLGYEAPDVRRTLRGTALVVGLAPAGSSKTDVPVGVLTAAMDAGLTRSPGDPRPPGWDAWYLLQATRSQGDPAEGAHAPTPLASARSRVPLTSATRLLGDISTVTRRQDR